MDKLLSGGGAMLTFFLITRCLTLKKKKSLPYLGTKLQLMLGGNNIHKFTCVINPINKMSISQSIKCL